MKYASKLIELLSGVLSRSKNRPIVDWLRDTTIVSLTNVDLLHFRITPSFYLLFRDTVLA